DRRGPAAVGALAAPGLRALGPLRPLQQLGHRSPPSCPAVVVAISTRATAPETWQGRAGSARPVVAGGPDLGRGEPQRDQRVDEHRDHRRGHERVRARLVQPAVVQSAPADDHDEGKRGRRVQAQDAQLPGRQHATERQPYRYRAHHQQRQDRQYQQRDRGGAAHQRTDVDAHPGGDEEERDEEPEADTLQLGLDDLGLTVGDAGEHLPDHHAGREGAQDDVEVKVQRQPHHAHQDQQGQPYRELRAGAQRGAQQPGYRRRWSAGGQRDGAGGDHREAEQEQRGVPRTAPAEQQGDGDDRYE